MGQQIDTPLTKAAAVIIFLLQLLKVIEIKTDNCFLFATDASHITVINKQTMQLKL